jgi:hypothetical protein
MTEDEERTRLKGTDDGVRRDSAFTDNHPAECPQQSNYCIPRSITTTVL